MQLNGTDVKGNADFDQLMNRHKPGERVKVVVERDGKAMEAEVILRGV